MNCKAMKFLSLAGALLCFANISVATTFNSSTTITGTGYDTIDVYDFIPDFMTTTIEFYGSTVNLNTYDSSTFNMRDGSVVGDYFNDPTSTLNDSSTVNVYSGAAFSGGSGSLLDLYNSATLNILGGSAGTFVIAHDSSTINMYSGILAYPGLCDQSTLNVYGGSSNTFLSNHYSPGSTATINIYASSYTYDPEAQFNYIDDPATGWWVSRLTATGLNGESIVVMGISDPSISDNINIIPEPTTLILLGIGALTIRKRSAV